MIPSSTLSHLCERLLRLVPHGQAKSFILWKTDSRADGDLRPRNRVDYHPKGRAYAVPKNCCNSSRVSSGRSSWRKWPQSRLRPVTVEAAFARQVARTSHNGPTVPLAPTAREPEPRSCFPHGHLLRPSQVRYPPRL